MLTIGLTLLAVTQAIAPADALTSGGASPYIIVLAQDAIPAEETAARELQAYLERVTGVQLPITQEGEAAKETDGDAKFIYLGPTQALRAQFPDIDLAALGHDGIVLKTAGDTLFLAGGRPRGTLYAVYTFLEENVGVRWWSPTEEYVPERPNLALPQLDTVYVPKLQCREAFYRGAFDGVYAARSKCNGHFERIEPEYGGHYTILGWCHTFYQILPPEKYFAEHPEWYSEIEGKRTADRTQLCLTNEEMRAEFIKNALEWVRKDPEAGIISISQNDWHGQCQCPKCRALEEQEGSPSGPIIHFVNAVAEAIEKEFPGTLVETLAYSYTRQAPKHAKPRKNVIVRLCSIECSYSQPLATGPQNETFKRDIESWSAISPQLYIWNYVTNFRNYILPHPNLRVLAPNIRFFIDHKAISLFEQGDSGCSCSDFPELRAWMLAHLMWDPSRKADALIDEFLNGYYGPAAFTLRIYIDLIHDAVERSGTYLRCYMTDTAEWLTLEDLNRATTLFDAAEAAVAADPVLAKRVRRARLPLDHVWLNRYYALQRVAKAEDRPWAGPKDPVAFCADFIKTAQSFDVGNYAEGRPFSDYMPRLEMRFREPGPPPEACEDLPQDQWADVQDNEFRLAKPGEWATLVDDAPASDGKAARMPANHTQWAVQYAVSADVCALGPLHCYVVARCDAKAAEGNAFQLGIYDGAGPGGVAHSIIPIEQASGGEYRTYDLGAHTLTPDMYFWVAPMNNPDQVEAVYVDRIFFVREKG